MPDEYQPTQPDTGSNSDPSQDSDQGSDPVSPSSEQYPPLGEQSEATSNAEHVKQHTDRAHSTNYDDAELVSDENSGETPTQPSEAPQIDDAPEASQAIPSVEEITRERDKYREQLQRWQADFENFKKRTNKQHRELSNQGKRDLLEALLPVVDALDQALKADTNDGIAYQRGVEGIHKQLLDVMLKRGITPIAAIGSDFDPTLHEAVSHESSENHRNNEVIEELRRGYMLDDILLRASMVKVAKA